MKDKIVEIIIEVCEDDSVKDNLDIDLIDSEIIDSFALVSLITKLEEEFNIELQPTQIKPDTWRSIDSIVKLVENKIS